jgi:hypothetical protein
MAEKQKPKTKPAAKRPKTEAAPELPEWLTETPIETEYEMKMTEGGVDCDTCQSIELSRCEFLLIKVYLAKLRGIEVPTSKPEGFVSSLRALPNIWDELEREEIAAVPEAAHA